jgi:hypothetical protein
MGADPLEDIAQVIEWVDAEALACRRDSRQDCGRLAAVVASKEAPIAPPNGNSAQAALGARTGYRLKRRWRDGTTHMIFEPLELVEKLAALVPPPRFNLVRYYVEHRFMWS